MPLKKQKAGSTLPLLIRSTPFHTHSKAELLFTRRLLRPNPDNASAWAHLRGLLSPALASSLPSPARRKLHSLVTEAAMAHMVLSKVGHHHQGEGWLHARDLLVDLQLSPLRDPSAPPTLLGLIRAKRLAERTLAESNAVLTVRRGYWEVGGHFGFGCYGSK